MSESNFQHDRIKEGKEEWLTPPEITTALGPFDLDPCSPVNRPWPTAAQHFTILDNGLIRPWRGMVWCNPPYGPKTGEWLARCAEHNNCIALVFARTETQAFQRHVFEKATALLFLAGRISFFHVSGKKGGAAGAPSVLVAYGNEAATRLRRLNFKGKHINLNSN